MDTSYSRNIYSYTLVVVILIIMGVFPHVFANYSHLRQSTSHLRKNTIRVGI